ncbi:hypothetical protein [Ferrimicrobium sp.]|uniref:hypothetical protein n=1 Tax=Ferrimicrobium sp. TaxID=2926050 RepID=UPI002632093A|nr:hypothetical protein [Ferrimicrobium sp.]
MGRDTSSTSTGGFFTGGGVGVLGVHAASTSEVCSRRLNADKRLSLGALLRQGIPIPLWYRGSRLGGRLILTPVFGAIDQPDKIGMLFPTSETRSKDGRMEVWLHLAPNARISLGADPASRASEVEMKRAVLGPLGLLAQGPVNVLVQYGAIELKLWRIDAFS